MNTQNLTQFLLASNQAGYATGEERQWTKEDDGSTTITFVQGQFRSHDNFFGGEPYGGRLVVFHNTKAVWMMVYYGWVESGANTDEVYKILREALKRMPEDAPFRGPKELTIDEYKYENNWQGNVERYEGQEKIMHAGKIIYQAWYKGGLVDQRAGV